MEQVSLATYKLGKVLGKGAYSRVIEAFSQKLSMTVAIKIIDKKQCPSDYINKFLPREISILTQCSHPNVTKLMEIMESSDGKFFLVMEMAQSDLYEKLDSIDHFSENEGMVLFRQIVEGLKYCHDKGIAHRDLKCENILMTSDNIPKLADFGFGVSLNGDTLSSTFCGTPAYAAPEILQGSPYDAIKADIWSLGIILYVMVTGFMPYDDSDLIKLLEYQKRTVEFPSSVKISDSCRDLISSMLNIDPNERPDVHHILKHPWFTN
ncbi:testis-specific serine/threonine-protein kinase 3-like [Discoglossus pictus]